MAPQLRTRNTTVSSVSVPKQSKTLFKKTVNPERSNITAKATKEYSLKLAKFNNVANTLTQEKFKGDTLLKIPVPLSPCDHEGPCGKGAKNCSCEENGFCFHDCRCSVRCEKRFPGCNCQAGKCRTSTCLCHRLGWECNPATCRGCRCEDADAPGACQNMVLSKTGLSKRCMQKKSQIKAAGNGLYLEEDVKKGQFILEYTGERIDNREADRRGEAYERAGVSYLFGLNEYETIDASSPTDIARFINHKFDDEANTISRTIVVNGEQRMAIFAKKNLRAGTEMFFDYGYEEEDFEAMFSQAKKRAKVEKCCE